MRELDFLRKIHEGVDEKSHIAITRDWSDEDPDAKYKDRLFYDQLYKADGFLKAAERIIKDSCEDSYFSINSFRRSEKQTCRCWHLNAFVLDFDFYKIEKYKNMSAQEMYERYLKEVLPLNPTAVVDSGRGLYILYCFKHAPKGMIPTYKAIYKTFYHKFKKYGMDQNAMNVTQIIRLPGSFNSKAFKEVEILEFNDTNYTLSDFFNLFKYTQEQVKKYKSDKKTSKENKELSHEQILKRYKFRDEQSEQIILDLKKLIEIRNSSGKVDGYREVLIYIARKRMRWKDSSLQDELNIAHELNNMFANPLPDKEVERNCKPYGMTRCCSIKTIITKLNITATEQMSMKILKKKSMKDSERAKRKRLLTLLNLTEKQRVILERRTRVAELKNEGKRNSQIAMILTVDKSTITRDLQYIKNHAWKFKKKLKEAMHELDSKINTDYFERFTRYDEQEKLLEWLKISQVLLE